MEEVKVSKDHLTFRLEKLGNSFKSNADIASFLLSFLKDKDSNPVIREGALLGLYNHVEIPGVIAELKEHLLDESSYGVIETIEDLLESHLEEDV